jgi:hypothetical protein
MSGAVIVAQLIGHDRAQAGDVVARGRSPAFALCRALLAADGWRWFPLLRNEPEALLVIFTINRGDAETGLDVPEDLAEAFFTGVAMLLWETLKKNGGAA